MKKRISVLLMLTTLLTVMAAFALPASAKTYGTYGDLYYEIDNGEVTITDCSVWADGTVIIPAELDGYPVTAIGNYSFWENQYVTSVVIPNSVITIGNGAFNNCIRLTSVEIGKSVTTIGDSAFENCIELERVVISRKVTAIGEWAFVGCESLEFIIFESPTTEIFDNPYTISDTAMILGFDDSSAEIYANKYQRLFGSLGTYFECVFDRKVTSSDYLKSAATCTSPAVYYYSCICGEKGTETFESGSKLGHSYQTEWSKDGSKHWYECSACGIKKDEATHTYDNACDTSCNVCGQIRASTHSYSTEWCTNEDEHWHECSVCGERKNAISYSHKWNDGEVTKEPTTSAEGIRTFTCKICKATKIEKIDKLPAETTTRPVTTESTPITTPNEGGEGTTAPVVTDKPTTDTPIVTDKPTTDAPTTDAPVTATPPSTTTKTPTVSSTDAEINPPADSDKDGDSPMLTVIAVLLVCLIGAVVTLTVVVSKKK